MISNAMLQQAGTILGQVANGVNIVVVPQSMSVGTAENPAICLKSAIQVNWVKKQMAAPEVRKYVEDDVAWDGIIGTVALDTLVIQEGVFDGTMAYRSAVIWHEHGHVLHGKTENGNVYLYEVTSLVNAVGVLDDEEIRNVLEARSGAYRAAVDPGVAALRQFLQQNWQITL
ncbi:hypothetical protein [Solwaraspora sp. WMMD792]|uniref:hypothetical protein n=1 Tax=Solwaraspora sp. WMMD792 TaxID=3016099 RepID=UPI0024169B14|nr:hypothetical protein [Solwaraspora sp. WMMD792]MDG4770349.1 hypothetical protein [Solwaraspora sp. WMMD792]